MAKQMRVGVKAALIGAGAIIIAAVITGLLTRPKSDSNETSTQEANSRKADVVSKDTTDPRAELQSQSSVIVYEKIQTNFKKEDSAKSKNQIINYAPNQGIQINENKGTIIVPKIKKEPRKFSFQDGEKILKDYPLDFPIEIKLKGVTEESKQLFKQVVDVVTGLRYTNVSTFEAVVYIGTVRISEKDFYWRIEDDKLVFSIFPQQ